MSADYDGVLADLIAKRDAMSELIAALQNVARLQPGRAAAAVVEEADHRPRRKAKTTPRAPATTKAKAKPEAGDSSRDAHLIGIVKGGKGLKLAEIVKTYRKVAKDDDVKPSALSKTLSRLVDEGRIARFGVKAGARYWPAGTSAKEAP